MASSDKPRPQGILKTDTSDSLSAASTNAPATGVSLTSASSPNRTPKSVSIAPKGELISPLILGDTKDVDELDLDRPRSPRKHRAKGPNAKRLSGRPSACSSSSSIPSWFDESGDHIDTDSTSQSEHHSWVGQIAAWIKSEKAKRDARRLRRVPTKSETIDANHEQPSEPRESSESVDLDALEQIIKEFPFGRRAQRKLSGLTLRRPARKLSHRPASTAASSDTEFFDGDPIVPAAEVVLDNSMTMSYTGGAAQSTDDLSLTRTVTASEEHWKKFKAETLRLIHTLRLKGWRRVPLEMSAEISIERLSGALTNAVYVVSPPEELPELAATTPGSAPIPKRKPAKLLLRIYGPQVEHLIDRKVELQILRRLARKHIGPRMLGTFLNGRFEEFFNAAPLKPEELRNPDTSRHIAKRMRELHDGIDLLSSEREDGPFVWRNWDKWLPRVQRIVQFLDSRVALVQGSEGSLGGYVCGAPWTQFHETVCKYRDWLVRQVGGMDKLTEQLVFAHNDTQYGNILRLKPSSTSPLLLPANSHKQLVVIDFEYANANTPGLEFANHFSEWCYNYHDPVSPWRCTHTLYPTPEEQSRFIRAYVRHRPDFNISTPRLTPATDASFAVQQQERPAGPTQSISNFMLDARAPAQQQAPSDPAQKEEDAAVAALTAHTRLWRMAVSAMWVAWGIVQAPVPGIPADDEVDAKPVSPEPRPEKVEDAQEEEEEFDYLAYTRDRAMLFWGDAVELGLVKMEDLPEDVGREIKVVKY